jgi:hypothetical protein
MKTFRITYTKTIESIIEIEAPTAADAWKKIKIPREGGKLDKDPQVVWHNEGELTYKAEKTEEITRHIASNPS